MVRLSEIWLGYSFICSPYVAVDLVEYFAVSDWRTLGEAGPQAAVVEITSYNPVCGCSVSCLLIMSCSSSSAIMVEFTHGGL